MTMSNIEKQLEEEKKRIDEMKAPPEFEIRLRKALDTTSRKPVRISTRWKTIVATLLLALLVGYNLNGLAYYGKKNLGFDELITGTLKDLNEAGMGQSIGKTYQLENGVELTIDGLMSDSNQMIIYYTLSDPNGIVDSLSYIFNPSKITGFFTDSTYEGGNGIINESENQFKGIMEFEPPSAFSKKLTLHFWQQFENGQMKDGEITFPYDPNKAMKAEIKQSINQTVEVDKGSIEFDSIEASPMVTVIKGTLDVENFDRLHQAFDEVALIANGKEVMLKGRNIRTSPLGTKFELTFDALPQPLDSLELDIKKFVGYQPLNETIILKNNQKVDLAGEKLEINSVEIASNGVEIIILTKESVLLDEVYIESNNEKIELQATKNQTLEKLQDGTIMKKRTLVFDTTKQPEKLIIGGLHYMKPYNIKVDIPVE